MSTKARWPFKKHLPVAVFFDLDDTLVDTAGQVVGPALEEATDAMINAGLRVDRAALIGYLRSEASASRGKNYFAAAAERFGANAPETMQSAVASAGRIAFFSATVPDLEPLPGSRGLLRQLRQQGCRLFLITAGKPSAQRRKVEQLGLSDAFDAVAFVDSLQGESKLPAFEDILERFAISPSACLCVGDRVVGEIRDANMLGIWTVRIRGGEFAAVEPSCPDEIPDLDVSSLQELAALLGIESDCAAAE
jgi:putative hydrolase of the HAD superfamily